MDPERIAITVDGRPACELLLSLAAVADLGEQPAYEVGPDWFARARALAGADLMDRLTDLSAGCSWAFGNLLGLAAVATPPPGDGQAFISVLRSTSDRELTLVLLGGTLRPFRRVTPRALLERAVDGDPVAVQAVRAASFPEHPTWPSTVARALARGTAATAALLRGVIEAWDRDVFPHLAPGLLPGVSRGVDELRAAVASARDPAAAIESATRGWPHVAEPGVTRVMLVPTVVGRPFTTTADHGDTRLFCVAVPDSVLGAAAADDPPAFLVRRLRALGDERRLRLLHRISAERVTLNDLARELDLPKTTLHHHLAILRDAGLVRLGHDAGTAYSPYPRYTPRRDAITGALGALDAWLTAAAPPTPSEED